jgi:folate receptor
MRKSSSFMCVLVVLLAGGAEATRPLPMESLVGFIGLFGMVSGQSNASGWGGGVNSCRRFDQIYANGEELCEVMWNDSFEYTTDESSAYTFWWFEGGSPGVPDPIPNPNDEIATLLGLTPKGVGDTCDLNYFHKGNVTPEPASFTECHPWHSASCCHEATVMTPHAINVGYGPGFRWDRCGTLSPACERFFVMEACFYECEPSNGLYRKYSDAQFFACNPTGANFPNGTFVTVPINATHNSTYMCDGGENQWQMWKMPIKASVCDSWFRACQEDFFCGGGNYFTCANDFHADVHAEAERTDPDQRDTQQGPLPRSVVLTAWRSPAS